MLFICPTVPDSNPLSGSGPQAVHSPPDSALCPAGHAAQSPPPCELARSGHGAHASPLLEELPAKQGAHVAAPAAAALPAWQGVAEALPAGQKLPGGHMVQAALPPGKDVPATQAWQLQATSWLPAEQLLEALVQPGAGVDVGWGAPVTAATTGGTGTPATGAAPRGQA